MAKLTFYHCYSFHLQDIKAQVKKKCSDEWWCDNFTNIFWVKRTFTESATGKMEPMQIIYSFTLIAFCLWQLCYPVKHYFSFFLLSLSARHFSMDTHGSYVTLDFLKIEFWREIDKLIQSELERYSSRLDPFMLSRFCFLYNGPLEKL